MPMLPVVNERGERLISISACGGTVSDDTAPTFALALVRSERGVLLVFNSLRRVWELPGGRIEPDETASAGAVRELFEETGQRAEELHWRALIELQLADGRIEYGALLCGELRVLVPFVCNDEATEIGFWTPESTVHPVSAIDAALLDYCSQPDGLRPFADL